MRATIYPRYSCDNDQCVNTFEPGWCERCQKPRIQVSGPGARRTVKNTLNLKDLHEHLGRLLAEGVDPDTFCVTWNVMGYDLASAADLPELGPAWRTEGGDDGEVWYFKDEVCSGEESPDVCEGVTAEKRTVLYL